jgi:hypothetical protein
MRGTQLLCICAAFLLLFSVGAMAAGSSSGGGRSSSSSPPIVLEPEKRDCEKESDLQKRIECRLEEKYEKSDNPEACRNLANAEACKALYERGYSCYIKKGPSKDKCFKEASGFLGIGAKGQSKETLRNYLVLVLYDLEERIELAYETKKITSENAALLITDITRIKRVVLENRSAASIKSMISDLKENYKVYMP